ncbi:HEAT repeat protein [Nannizzia gypsea CBS 118893]|uniref:HEAT repeat protein n=1 Tax=Arthroderma gypseum (strain ATCC MYA-4604 / CBS 118893) TaxID=535722 RepID=E4UQA2_ARTGP|nr:HEAT repeat protein [Nannizzia gypsea CBS 118893]EFQ99183.1 HEAT repeat protein [Nannizzia gypsea CBS 118893]
MEDIRQKTFQKLRPPCVELSSITLKFKGNLASSNEVLRALDTLYQTLKEVVSYNGLDEKLAEYSFFPLSQIFNESRRISAQCVELALKCLQILIEKGWRSKLSAELGKQLLILMTLLSGGPPAQAQGQGTSTPSRPRSEELIVAAFDCVSSMCRVLHGPAAAASIFNEIGPSTIIDQTVYVLLEAVVDGASNDIQKSAAVALNSLQSRITDRVVLASLLPRTVSSLTKVLRGTAQQRRPYKLLCACLEGLTMNIKFVLNDLAVSSTTDEMPTTTDTGPLVLDKSWLNATTSQIKLALSHVIRLRNHEKDEVRHSLLGLCLMVIEDCPNSLADSLSMMVETVVVLAHHADEKDDDEAYRSLKHLLTSSETVSSILKSNLHSWIVALPRVMQSADDAAKSRVIRQISTAFEALSDTQIKSDILDDTMTSSLHDSISAILMSSQRPLQPLGPPIDARPEALSLTGQSHSNTFQPVIFERQSQRETLLELQTMISRLSNADLSLSMTKSMLNKLYRSPGDSFVSSLWLTLSFLKSASPDTLMIDDILNVDSELSSTSRPQLIEEIYSLALPILTDLQNVDSDDWRTPALALEAVALQAGQLQESFRPELIDTLYPILQLMGSSNPALQNHAMTCLNIVTASCNYPDASTLVIENVDYLINSVALKLNTFDISPQAPKVLLMMIKLSGSRLIPHLDDIIGSIFAVLDAFHGYPKLVELLFGVLGAIVDEGAKQPALLAISNEDESTIHQQRRLPAQPRSVSTIAAWFKERREKRSRELKIEEDSFEPLEPHPKKPWSSLSDKQTGEDDEMEINSQADQSEQPQEPEEKPLSKPHTLLLNIIKSIPPHLSSPSPFLRRSLLSILTRGLPILSQNEKTFLPLINDLWPSVSARITLPAQTGGESQALSTSLKENKAQISDSGIQEETFVTVASCTAIGTMCKGAGDFMSSRIEHEFPRWKRLYKSCWTQVKEDAEKSVQRQRQQLAKKQIQDADVSGSSASAGLVKVIDEPSQPLPRTSFNITKSFTRHHSLWKALTTLYITILSHVTLPADIGDEICYALADWITFFHPELFPANTWKEDGNTDGSLSDEDTDSETRWSKGTLKEAKRALRAMDGWNSDLAWLACAQARARHHGNQNAASLGLNQELRALAGKMNHELERLLGNQAHGEAGNLRFATPVF